MSKHGTIRRYTLIIEKIENDKPHPSFKDIQDYLTDHDFQVSRRTIERDMEQIRWEFGIDIKYNKIDNYYWINYEDSIDINSFFRFLEIVNTAELLTESLAESKDSLKYISFENNGSLKGIEQLKQLLHAIKSNRVIEFNHTNFYDDKTKKYRLRPYLLKEYQNRWYVVGQYDKIKEFRTFGIERISELKVMTETFKPDTKQNPSDFFNNTIGIIYSLNKLQKVVLSFTPIQGKYIKTLPLHSSQEIIIDNDKECRIELNIIPNYELTHLILMQGDNVKVLEPKWLVDEIKLNLKNTLALYKGK